jgi:hypothetical protein
MAVSFPRKAYVEMRPKPRMRPTVKSAIAMRSQKIQMSGAALRTARPRMQSMISQTP